MNTQEALYSAWRGIREIAQEHRDDIFERATKHHLYLDGKPAVLAGRLLKFPKVVTLDLHKQVEFSRKCIEYKLEKYQGNNIYFFST